MKLRFFTPLSLGVSAMLFATCGYAGAQAAQQNTQTQTTQQNSEQPPKQEVATPNAPYTVAPNTKLVSVVAALQDSLKSEDATQGQTVKAKLTNGANTANGMKLEKGTVLLGKVDQVQKSSNNGPGKISVTFDQAQLKDGRTVPVKATLLAAYPPETDDPYTSGMVGNPMPGSNETYISAEQKIEQQPGKLGNVAMHSAVKNNDSGTFTNSDGNVSLRKGTRLQIAIAPMNATMG